MGSRKSKHPLPLSKAFALYLVGGLVRGLLGSWLLSCSLDAGRLEQRRCFNSCPLRRRHTTESRFCGYHVNGPPYCSPSLFPSLQKHGRDCCGISLLDISKDPDRVREEVETGTVSRGKTVLRLRVRSVAD